MPKKNNSTCRRAFSLVEVVIAIALVGGVMAMIMGAVVILNRAVANERVIPFVHTSGAQAWAYQDLNNVFPSFTAAPSRLADAQADALWRQMREVYEQSKAVAMMDRYLIIDFSPRDAQNQPSPRFIGSQGFLSANDDGTRFPVLTREQLTSNLFATLSARPWPVLNDGASRFLVWNPAAPGLNIDTNTLRTNTIFFLDSEDRILAILRMRAWQFDANSADPYRYYEVNLTRLRWTARAPNGVDQAWRLADTGTVNLLQDYAYRFVEDRRFPQDLIFPPTQTMLNELSNDGLGSGGAPGSPGSGDGVPITTNVGGRNLFVRLATEGENYNWTSGDWTDNVNPGISRRQVSLVPSAPWMLAWAAPVDEWHLILPDPSLGQAEDRAKLRLPGATYDVNLDMGFRRQGKYGCVLSVYP